MEEDDDPRLTPEQERLLTEACQRLADACGVELSETELFQMFFDSEWPKFVAAWRRAKR